MAHRLPSAVPDARSRPDVLDRAECIRLLQTVPIGRLVFVHDGYPRAYPINFTSRGLTVWFRTDTVGAAASLPAGARVAFEADAYDAWQRTGWSVLIIGQLVWPSPDEMPGALTAEQTPWAPGVRDRLGRLDGRRISGRRITLPRRS